MKTRMVLALVIALASGVIMTVQAAGFIVYDATHHRGKPDLTPYGMQPIKVVYEGELFGDNRAPNAFPTAAAIERVARNAAAHRQIVVLDVERWIWTSGHVDRYVDLARRFNAISPQVDMGYYGTVPKRDYWRARKGGSDPEYLAWQRENERLRPIVAEVDALYPSLYTFYDYRPGWVEYAQANIRQARRLAAGRPVYAFLWFTYHDSNADLRGKAIPRKFWRLQLETLRSIADGVVIWGGGTWDENAPWWVETRRFLATLQRDNLAGGKTATEPTDVQVEAVALPRHSTPR